MCWGFYYYYFLDIWFVMAVNKINEKKKKLPVTSRKLYQ